ncbi:oligosaccharide flippase family protein [Vibrio cholerae]|uniref:oligosaccharide flippase family protein n=1 Tax=Vibrio cholerae TaxID=666 RepID=UPI00205D738A|nr:oligosaccharide flippase family protein [Vibrio cholerae]EGR4059733.1 flippase [Vibrio cholerae]EGR4418278.1 flippase [Vibrio cholerae]MDW4531404.1 oligosaccharide flippase family protein [Vibrio cholerae]BCN19383.1 putative O-antigen flippase [Vibrio cholerae]GIC07582.1 putative polisoprenol-linked O-antigen transporter [Vibrio cholerae]
MASLKKNVISLFILQGSNYVIPLLTLPYLTRTLGVEGFGIFGLVIAVAQYFVLFTDFGFNLTATKKIAENQNNKNYISKVFWDTIISKSILCIISLCSLLLIACFFPTETFKKELVCTSLMVLGTVIMPLWYFQGIEELSKVTILSVLAKFITLPLFFLLVNSEDDVGAAILIQASINFTAGIIAIIIIYRSKMLVWIRTDLESIKKTISEGSSIFIATLTINIYTASSSIIISITNNIEQVSVFTAGDRIKAAILGAFLILGNAFYPRVNSLLKSSPEQAYALIRKIILLQTPVTIIIGCALYAFSEELSILIYGNEFNAVADVFRIFSPLFFLVLTSTVLGNYLLLPLGHKKEYVALPIIVAFIHIILCSLLSYYYGAVGSAISILIVELITFFCLIYIVRKKGILPRLKNGLVLNE